MGTIAVTGGAGFIGPAVVRLPIRETEEVVVNIDKLAYAGNFETLADIRGGPRHVFMQIDICDESSLREVVEEFPAGPGHTPGGGVARRPQESRLSARGVSLGDRVNVVVSFSDRVSSFDDL